MENSKKLQRAELLIFTIISILNMLPFVATRFFPSMDGASHLSNSNIINQLLFHNNSLFSQFFILNPEPVPNWTSHLLVSILGLIMPAFLAEKILITILLIGTPFAFRSLVQLVSPKNVLYSYLVFPFTHSMFFFFGFFNFCMGILLLLITLNYWLRHGHKPLNPLQTVVLTLFMAITYFSHIVLFGLLLILIGLHIIAASIVSFLSKNRDAKIIALEFLKKTVAVTLAALIPLILFVYFFYSRPGIREITYINGRQLADYLLTVRPLISLNPFIEGKLTVILFYLLAFLGCAGIIAFFIRLVRKFRTKNEGITESTDPLLPGFNFWWLLSSMVLLLVLFFKLPDAYGTASYTNLRIGFVLFLVAILFVSTFRIPRYFGLIAAITVLYVNTMLIRYYTPAINDLGKLASECNKAAAFANPNSLVLPIYCLDNWFTGHFVDYLSVDKPLVMVYNYECQSGYFPVKWNDEAKPNYYLGNPATPEKYVNFELTKGRPSMMVDYVFVVGQYNPEKDWFFKTLHKILTEDFTCVYQAANCSLYHSKIPGPVVVR